MLSKKQQAIIDFVRANQPVKRDAIHKGVTVKMGESTISRLLLNMTPKLIKANGEGKARTYSISNAYELFVPIDLEAYYKLLPEERSAKKSFNLDLIPKVLSKAELFTKEEMEHLNDLHNKYIKNIAPLSKSEYKKELEILAIDLSWKSGEIEGNTYTLLETEVLLKYNELAEGKKQDDATMLLNHKHALDFIIAEPDYLKPLTIANIEDIHSILIKNLGVERNMRQRGVKVGGTDYKPLSVKPSDYKKAMLLFYEQNNLTEFKKIFISQYEYAVNKYFNLEPEATG